MVYRRINKVIWTKILEIILLCVLIVISLPIYLSWQQKSDTKVLANVNNMDLLYTSIGIDSPLEIKSYPITNEEALTKIKSSKITVTNESWTAENYTLVLTISKDSTLDFNCLNIAINDEIQALNTLELKEDASNYHFIIDCNNLKADDKEYNVKLWIDEKTNNNMQNKKLIFSFEVKNGTYI